jgi:hypothetical protein
VWSNYGACDAACSSYGYVYRSCQGSNCPGSSYRSCYNYDTCPDDFPIAIVAGGAAGGLLLIGILVYCFCCRRKKRNQFVTEPAPLTSVTTVGAPFGAAMDGTAGVKGGKQKMVDANSDVVQQGAPPPYEVVPRELSSHASKVNASVVAVAVVTPTKKKTSASKSFPSSSGAVESKKNRCRRRLLRLRACALSCASTTSSRCTAR